jgi:hypothetical protein
MMQIPEPGKMRLRALFGRFLRKSYETTSRLAILPINAKKEHREAVSWLDGEDPHL